MRQLVRALIKLFSKGGRTKGGKFIAPNPTVVKRLSSVQRLEQEAPLVWKSLSNKPTADIVSTLKKIKTGKLTANDIVATKKLSPVGSHVHTKAPTGWSKFEPPKDFKWSMPNPPVTGATLNKPIVPKNIHLSHVFLNKRNELMLNKVFNDLAKQMGEKIEGKLMGGAQGAAMRTERGRILKLTSNPMEVASAMRARQRSTVKHIIKPYSISKITINGESTQYYVILMDEITVLSDREQKLWNIIQTDFLNLRSNFTNKEIANRVIERLKAGVYSGFTVNEIDSFMKKILPQRQSILKDFGKLKIHGAEAHPGNVGFDRNGRFKHFDSWNYLKQDPMLKKINRGSAYNVKIDPNMINQIQ